MASSESIEYFENTISRDLFQLCMGKKLGRGSSREVFEWCPNTDYVAKIEIATRSFSNAIEWDVWHRVKGTKAEQWFAPCIAISPCGTVMLQRRTKTRDQDQYPTEIPRFFTDTKYSNFGFIGDQLVCHDYGLNLLIENGMKLRMKKAEWWSHP